MAERHRKHFVELTDQHGNAVRLSAGGVLIGKCSACLEINIAMHNSGMMRCTYCGAPVEWQWSTPQLAFLPEQESQFMGWDRGKRKKE